MLKAFFVWFFEALLKFLWSKGEEQRNKKNDEKLAKEEDNKKTKEAVAEVRKPLDPKKSVEEREKEMEDRFDKFKDKLN